MTEQLDQNQGKNLFELMIEDGIISAMPTQEDMQKNWVGRILGGGIRGRDAVTLMRYSKGKEVICSRSCFLGTIVLLRGERNYFAYIWVNKLASDRYNSFWKRLELNEAKKYLEDSTTKMYNQEGWKMFLRTLLLEALQ